MKTSHLVFTVVAVLVALHVQQPFEISVSERLDLAPWVAAVAAGIGLAGVRLAQGRFSARPAPWSLVMVLLLASLVSWVWTSVGWSDQPVVALATAAAQTGNLILFMIFAVSRVEGRSVGALNEAVFKVGVAVSVMALFLFLLALLRFPPLEKEGVGWVYDRGLALRLRGLTDGPNVFSIYLSISLFTGLAGSLTRRRLMGIGLIGVTLLFAMSRSVLASIVLVLVLSPLILALHRRAGSWGYARRVILFLLAIALVGTLAALFNDLIRDFFFARVTSVEQQSRLPKWIEAARLIKHPVRGNGLRTADAALGHFTHNTYLDYFVELGFVGAVLWVTFVLGVLTAGAVRCVERQAFPWLQGWLLVMFATSTFSLMYSPFIAVVAGVLVMVSNVDRGTYVEGDTPVVTPP